MKLVIHAGLHKTATTSFQKMCRQRQKDLASVGVLYPRLDSSPQHSHLIWEVQKSGPEALSTFLRDCVAGTSGIDTVLLSGEDFENCLVDTALARRIEEAALSVGFEEVVWAFVVRDMADYASSLYSEMSKQGVALNFNVLAKAARERGCFYLSTPTYNFIFVLDHDRFADAFRSSVNGRILRFAFAEFLRPTLGENLLREALGGERYDRLVALGPLVPPKSNERRSDLVVEFWYSVAFLGMRDAMRNPIVRALSWVLLFPIILLRWVGVRQDKAAFADQSRPKESP